MRNDYFTPNPGQKQIIPDPLYNPNNATFINAGTKLAKGITIGKFLGGTGEKTNLNHVQSQSERLQIARNLYPQAVAMNRINNSLGKFVNHRLIVIEGLYTKGANEQLVDNGLNDLATKGRAIVYQLINQNGAPDHAMMFDLAVYWKDTILYDKLILDYDRFAPDGHLECHVILTMPQIPQNFKATYKKELSTTFNGNVQTNGELLEILA
jgi:hypothetical protein